MPRWMRRRSARSIRGSIASRAASFTAVTALGNRNVQREYYLTDIIEIACKNGLRATSFPASDPDGGDGDQHTRRAGAGRPPNGDP